MVKFFWLFVLLTINQWCSSPRLSAFIMIFTISTLIVLFFLMSMSFCISWIELCKSGLRDSLQHLLGEDSQKLPADVQSFLDRSVLIMTLQLKTNVERLVYGYERRRPRLYNSYPKKQATPPQSRPFSTMPETPTSASLQRNRSLAWSSPIPRTHPRRTNYDSYIVFYIQRWGSIEAHIKFLRRKDKKPPHYLRNEILLKFGEKF